MKKLVDKPNKTKYNNSKATKNFIDFSKLSDRELDRLSEIWENKAKVFEYKLQGYMFNPDPNGEKLNRLWDVGKAVWRRLYILETWRRKNRPKKSK